MIGQSRHAVGRKKLVLIGVQWTKSVDASITRAASRAPPEPAMCTRPSGDSCGMLSRGAWVSPSALALDKVMFPTAAKAAIRSVTPPVQSGPRRRESFIALELPPDSAGAVSYRL